MTEEEWKDELIPLLEKEGWVNDVDDEFKLGFSWKKGNEHYMRDYNKKTRSFVQFNANQIVTLVSKPKEQMLRPLNKYIVAKLVEKEKKGTLILTTKEEKKDTFDVISVSNDLTDIKIGDRILTDSYGVKEHEIDGEMFHLIHFDRVVGVMT